MDTRQLAKALPYTDISVGGIYPVDKLPLVWPKPCAIIANTDNHNQPGTHWVALFIDHFGYGIFFDSFGQRPTDPRFTYVLRRNTVFYEYNNKRLQDFSSNVCGCYCIAALHHFSTGGNLSSFQRLFGENTKLNDNIIMTMYKKIIQKKNILKNRRFHFLRGSGATVQHSYCKFY